MRSLIERIRELEKKNLSILRNSRRYKDPESAHICNVVRIIKLFDKLLEKEPTTMNKISREAYYQSLVLLMKRSERFSDECPDQILERFLR